MANVLVVAYSNVTWTPEKYLDSFVEGFIVSLSKCGNKVLKIRTNDFVTHPVNSSLQAHMSVARLMEHIHAFKPDLIVAFNNSLPCKEVLEQTNCPVLLYAADSPAFFAYKDLIKKYQDRYYFLDLTPRMTQSMFDWFPGIRKDHVIPFGYATALQALPIKQDINISFLGSMLNYSRPITEFFTESSSNEVKDRFFVEMDKFQRNPLDRFDYKLEGFNCTIPIESLCIHMLSAKDRFFLLSSLTDLGLRIHGYKSFCDAGVYNYDILRCYNFDLCVTMEQTAHLFNRSKISLHTSSAQAIDGLSWRVCDILSSNAVLLSQKKKDLVELMRGYADLPMFESVAEARDIAQRLLADEAWRKDLSLASQKMIDDKCRFEKKFSVIQQVLGITLVQNIRDKPADVPVSHLDVIECQTFIRLLVHRIYCQCLLLASKFIPSKFQLALYRWAQVIFGFNLSPDMVRYIKRK